jgi:uncharacterized protein
VGNDGQGSDAPLAASLREHLGDSYEVRAPRMPDGTELPDFGWPRRIGDDIERMKGGQIFLVGHSLGASMILKYLSERPVSAPIRGAFLLATPFWSGDEEWKSGLKLRDDFASALPEDVPVFLYHCEDDEEVDVSDLAIYQAKLPRAIVRRMPKGGHQFDNDLAFVARDIQGRR